MERNTDYQQLLQICKELYTESNDIEVVLEFVRNEIGRKTTSIKVVTDLLETTIVDAKILVQNSKTWSEERKRDEAFSQTVAEVISQSL